MKINSKNFEHYILGFTLTESLCALCIVSVISCSLCFAVSVCARCYEESEKKIAFSRMRLTSDSILRYSLGQVCLPFWIKEPDYSFNENVLSINFFQCSPIEHDIVLDREVLITKVEPLYSNNKCVAFRVCLDIKGRSCISIYRLAYG